MSRPNLTLLRRLAPHKHRKLRACVIRGDLVGARHWLLAGANPDLAAKRGAIEARRTPLQVAVCQENADMVDLLLAYGARVEASTGTSDRVEMGAFSLWGQALARAAEPSTNLRRIGVALLGAGADLQSELAPMGRGMIFDALTVNGKLPFLVSVVSDHEARAQSRTSQRAA